MGAVVFYGPQSLDYLIHQNIHCFSEKIGQCLTIHCLLSILIHLEFKAQVDTHGEKCICDRKAISINRDFMSTQLRLCLPLLAVLSLVVLLPTLPTASHYVYYSPSFLS